MVQAEYASRTEAGPPRPRAKRPSGAGLGTARRPGPKAGRCYNAVNAMNRILPLAAGLLLASLLGACVDAPPRPDGDADAAARNLFTEGRFLDAAAEFQRLAALAQGEAAWHFTLSAAHALIAGSRPDEALAQLADGDWGGASAAQQRERAALRAELVLARGDAREALRLLPDALVDAASPSIARGMRKTRAAAYHSLGLHLPAARERVAWEELDLRGEDASANRRAVWNALQAVTTPELEAARIRAGSRLSGWIDLTLQFRGSMFDHARFQEAVRAWRERYPDHPAGKELARELIAESAAFSTPPAKVALLLPAHGAFAEAARAIRDGFLAGWYRHADTEARPALIIRDTSGADIGTLVAGVVEEGAEIIVGPLQKSSVRDLARLGRPAIPVLALNRLPADAAARPPKGFYQFSLSPEDEAREVAGRAWSDGYARAGILAPEGVWGTRVARAFSAAWEELGGRIVETQYYSTGNEEGSEPPDMSMPVEALLNLDESRLRRDDLRKTLRRRVHFEARYRSDLDLVFMAGFPREARQLRPQFEFHAAGSVPMYSTSHVYSGVPDPEADSDVDDIVFGDMPMVLSSSGERQELRGQLSSLWPDRLRVYLRLYSFGLDAFDLVTRLRYLEAAPLHAHAGHTGLLRLTESGSIHRQLSWARFRGGLPLPLPARGGAP